MPRKKSAGMTLEAIRRKQTLKKNNSDINPSNVLFNDIIKQENEFLCEVCNFTYDNQADLDSCYQNHAEFIKTENHDLMTEQELQNEVSDFNTQVTVVKEEKIEYETTTEEHSSKDHIHDEQHNNCFETIYFKNDLEEHPEIPVKPIQLKTDASEELESDVKLFEDVDEKFDPTLELPTVDFNNFEQVTASKQKLTCQDCFLQFNNEEKYMRHRLAKHPTEPKYKCQICSRGFVNLTNYQSHINTSHICCYCNKQFHNKGKLQRHIKELHSFELKFQCPKCKRKLKNKENLIKHITVCLYTCNSKHVKNKECTSSMILNAQQFHQQVVKQSVGQPVKNRLLVRNAKKELYICEYCGNKFSCKYDIVRHFQSYHKFESPKITIKITGLLAQKFQQQPVVKQPVSQPVESQLLVRNTDKKVFICEYCGDKFSCKFDIVRHFQSYHKFKSPKITIRITGLLADVPVKI